ncbi:protein KRTCAP2 homolog [Ornithodoros turicata]|uniref:Putative secreted salivary gland peptide n=1 Tax=Ornithodoros turicata TaxID=34597 RepID=A0A2R5LH60_9ACAR
MSVSSGASGVLSLCLFCLLFAAMQIYRTQLTSSQPMTIVGGFLGSILFILILTFTGNVQKKLFGHAVQTKLFPEVVGCMVLAMTAAGMVHRVCVTTCFIFSLLALYYLSKISVKTYGTGVSPPPAAALSKSKKGR